MALWISMLVKIIQTDQDKFFLTPLPSALCLVSFCMKHEDRKGNYLLFIINVFI